MGNIATGLIAGIIASLFSKYLPLLEFTETTMIGALIHYITNTDIKYFHPMKPNFGILPPLLTNIEHGKRARASAYSKRALIDLNEFIYRRELF